MIEIVEETAKTDFIRSRNRVVNDVDDRQHDRVVHKANQRIGKQRQRVSEMSIENQDPVTTFTYHSR